MDAYLRTHPTTAGWRDNRLRLRDTPHFAKYRTKQHDARYEGAVHALSAGTATADDLELARALGGEIAASPLIIRSGQVLLTGEIDEDRLLLSRHASFRWATIHPVSAVESAESEKKGEGYRSLPTVHVLHLEQSLPALLGRARPRGKWDLLLPRRLRLTFTATHNPPGLNIREAILGV